MSSIANQGIDNEWLLLQKQYDEYEKYSLFIKLLSIVILCVFSLFSSISYFTVIILLILWMQDAIWKTFQSRIEPRLLALELSVKNAGSTEHAEAPYQFNSQYMQSRPGQAGLINEYLVQAIRPTIAYPHILLIALALFEFFNK